MGLTKTTVVLPTMLSPLGKACARMDLTAVHDILLKTGYKDEEGAENEVSKYIAVLLFGYGFPISMPFVPSIHDHITMKGLLRELFHVNIHVTFFFFFQFSSTLKHFSLTQGSLFPFLTEFMILHNGIIGCFFIFFVLA